VSIISPATASPVRNFYTTPTALLTWTRTTWATGYELQVSSSSSFTGSPLIPVAANNSTFTTGTLENGTYYWHVRAIGGSSSWSPTDSFIIHAPG